MERSWQQQDGVTTSKVIDRLGREQETTFINEEDKTVNESFTQVKKD